MSYVRILGNGRPQVMKDLAFCTLLEGQLPNDDQLFSTLFNSFDELVRIEDSRITREALSNVHGDWYE